MAITHAIYDFAVGIRMAYHTPSDFPVGIRMAHRKKTRWTPVGIFSARTTELFSPAFLRVEAEPAHGPR